MDQYYGLIKIEFVGLFVCFFKPHQIITDIVTKPTE